MSANTKSNYIDLLDEDKPIAGQKFSCISFVSPDNILKKKELFYFEEFVKTFDFSKSMEKYQQFTNFISYKYNIKFDDIMSDFEEFMKSEREQLKQSDMDTEYKNFTDKHEERLEKEFNETHNFQTNVRGIKIRGSFPSQKEAELRAKMLREQDPNHDIYVGPVGMWIPWEPEAYKTGRVEYLEEDLNKLMSEKKTNEEQANNEFEERVKETKQKAINENRKIALESGNKLTQNIDEQGHLVGVANMNTTENVLQQNEVVTSADIKKELFDNDEVERLKK